MTDPPFSPKLLESMPASVRPETPAPQIAMRGAAAGATERLRPLTTCLSALRDRRGGIIHTYDKIHTSMLNLVLSHTTRSKVYMWHKWRGGLLWHTGLAALLAPFSRVNLSVEQLVNVWQKTSTNHEPFLVVALCSTLLGKLCEPTSSTSSFCLHQTRAQFCSQFKNHSCNSEKYHPYRRASFVQSQWAHNRWQ